MRVGDKYHKPATEHNTETLPFGIRASSYADIGDRRAGTLAVVTFGNRVVVKVVIGVDRIIRIHVSSTHSAMP